MKAQVKLHDLSLRIKISDESPGNDSSADIK
jgi:hypothetical protein